jgi:hypothetical protein
MATTAGGTPYVESSDLVANYPAISLDLAEHIDTKANLASPTFTGTVTIPNVNLLAWTAYTPTVSQMTLGNGTTAAEWARVGKTIFYRGLITLGSTTTLGASAPTVSIPVNARTSGANVLSNQGINHYYDLSAGARLVGKTLVASNYMILYLNIRRATDDLVQVFSATSGSALTIGAGDIWFFTTTYEAV